MATKNAELENCHRWQHFSSAAINRRLWEICFKYRRFAIYEFHYCVLQNWIYKYIDCGYSVVADIRVGGIGHHGIKL